MAQRVVVIRSGYEGLRQRIEYLLEELSRRVAQEPQSSQWPTSPAGEDRLARQQSRVGFLGQLLAAWPTLGPEALPESGAGLGATVLVEDLDTGSIESCTLMSGPLLDPDAGHVSLASPMGQALIGVSADAIAEVRTPQRTRRLRVIHVRTLTEKLHEYEPSRSAA